MKKIGKDVDYRINEDSSVEKSQLLFWQKALYFLLAFIIMGSFAIIIIQRGQIKNLEEQNMILIEKINGLETKNAGLQMENAGLITENTELKQRLEEEKNKNERLRKINESLQKK